MQTERAIMEIDYFSQVFLTKTVLPTFYSKIRTYCLCVECRGFARNTVPCQLFGSQSRYSYVGQQLARRSGRAGRWGFGDLPGFVKPMCHSMHSMERENLKAIKMKPLKMVWSQMYLLKP